MDGKQSNLTTRTLLLASIAAVSTIASSAHAYVSCVLTPTEVFSADGGNLYVFFSNGGLGYIRADNANYKTTVALATAAILAQKDVTVRYVDGTACNAKFALFEGLGLPR
jgi:hypothetical protein